MIVGKLDNSSSMVREAVMLLIVCCASLAGCRTPRLVGLDEYAEFQSAGVIAPHLDKDKLIHAKVPDSIYHIVPGDILSLHMPVTLCHIEMMDVDAEKDYQCRVDEDYKITLPIVGTISVKQMDLAQIEKAVIDLYYPKYVTQRPSVIARVKDYHTQSVSISGAVVKTGTYLLNSNEMSIISLINKAGGIVGEGAASIRIIHAGCEDAKPVVLPVKGLNMPFADIALKGGDYVEVEQANREDYTVVGLVKMPGAVKCHPEVKYNAMQVIAMAGGVDRVTEPKYVTIFRQKKDGKIIKATFKINGKGHTNAYNVRVKPGDIISVDQTDRTKFRASMSQILKMTLGMQMIYRVGDDGVNSY